MKNDEAWVSKFVSLLEEYAREEGLEFPHVPDSAGRRAYLRFLASMGCTEEELLPLVQHEKATPEVREEVAALTMQALLNPKVREGPQFKDIIWLTLQMFTGRDNTNVIIHWLASTLHSELRDAGIQVPDHYPGVFPTDSFNAQCRIFDGEPLVLLDTGCLEMAEAVIITFLSRLAEADQADEISATVEQYVSTGARPDPFSSTMYGIDWGSLIVPSFVNSFERYVLAHEMGHLTLGHIKGGQVRQQSPQIGGAFEVAAKSQFDEFQADMWACQALIQRAQGVRESEFSVALALAGPIVALNVGLIVEGACRARNIDLRGGHPPAAERLYMLNIAYELIGVSDEAYIGRGFSKLTEQILERHYPETEPPLFLSRELNRKLIPVLDSLGIDYRGADYITDFV